MEISTGQPSIQHSQPSIPPHTHDLYLEKSVEEEMEAILQEKDGQELPVYPNSQELRDFHNSGLGSSKPMSFNSGIEERVDRALPMENQSNTAYSDYSRNIDNIAMEQSDSDGLHSEAITPIEEVLMLRKEVAKQAAEIKRLKDDLASSEEKAQQTKELQNILNEVMAELDKEKKKSSDPPEYYANRIAQLEADLDVATAMSFQVEPLKGKVANLTDDLEKDM